MQKFLSVIVIGSAGMFLGSFSGGAAAQANYVFDSISCGVSGGTSSCTAGGVNSQITAWSNNGSGGAYAQAQLAAFGVNGFGAYSGNAEGSTGTTAATDNQHAFDSIISGCGPKDAANTNTNTANSGCGGSQELMLINFGAKVNLSSMSVGFCGTSPKECDVSILRWDGGNSGPNLALNGLSGWTLVASQDLGGSGTNGSYTAGGNTSSTLTSNVSLGNQVSSWWMISTYFGATTSTLDAGNDRFKVLSVAANVCTGGSGVNGGTYNGGNCSNTVQVPEPGSLALVGLALLGALAARRNGNTFTRRLAF